MAIDFTTDLGKVRALIPDTDEADLMLSDAMINAYLSISGDRVLIAAALAIEAIAVDEALTYKITRADDFSVNGVSGAEQLLAKAKLYRQQAAQDDASVEEAFSLVPTVPSRTYCRPEATPWPVW